MEINVNRDAIEIKKLEEAAEKLIELVAADFRKNYKRKTRIEKIGNTPVIEYYFSEKTFAGSMEWKEEPKLASVSIYRDETNNDFKLNLTLKDPRLRNSIDYVKGFLSAYNFPEEKLRVTTDFDLG